MCSWYAVAAPGDDDDVDGDDVDGDDVDGGDVADGVPAGDDGAVEVHAPSARVMAAPTPRRFTRWFGLLGKGGRLGGQDTLRVAMAGQCTTIGRWRRHSHRARRGSRAQRPSLARAWSPRAWSRRAGSDLDSVDVVDAEELHECQDLRRFPFGVRNEGHQGHLVVPSCCGMPCSWRSGSDRCPGARPCPGP